ncbi:acyl-CoA-binding protein [bacterium]|nr:acyl-CoA-binding protein [bacterium]
MDAELKALFEEHVRVGKGLPPQSADHMLIAYAYYKQAMVGDNELQRPLHSDVIRTFKHDAWVRLKGMSQEEAMRGYIAHIKMLVALSKEEGRLG